ncbi:hypothetical protein HYW94_01190 [Candidatus Uhrbacteria bacterium]|nr:hypothetical protein [Candidatus Uhrbacteria bacterium]
MHNLPIRLKATLALHKALEDRFHCSSWGVTFCADLLKENRHALIGEATSDNLEIVFIIFVLERYDELIPYHIIIEKEDGEQFAWILSHDGEMFIAREVSPCLSPFWNDLFPKNENTAPP